MPNVQPIRETIQHHLGNAAQIAELYAAGHWLHDIRDAHQAFAGIRDHLKAALAMLGEPSFDCIQAAGHLLREYENRAPREDTLREIRDVCAGIIHAQVTGVQPKTWSQS
jgi:hypothetical protein